MTPTRTDAAAFSQSQTADLLKRAKALRDSDPAGAKRLLGEALSHPDNRGASELRADCLLQFGHCLELEGTHGEALDYLGQGLRMYEAIGNAEGMARCLRGEGQVYRSLSLYHLSAEKLFRSLALLQELDIPIELGRSFQNLSVIFTDLGFVQESIEFARAALEAFDRAGEVATSLYSLNDLVHARAAQLKDITQLDLADGFPDAAQVLAEADRAIELARQMPPSRVTCSLHASKAKILLVMGQPDEALASLATARELADTMRIPFTRARIAALTAEAHLQLGQFSHALALARETVERYAAVGSTMSQAEALALASQSAAKLEQWDLALELLRSADDLQESALQERLRSAFWASAVPA